MRRWHRWLSILFGLFLLWIAVTGFLSQVAPLVLGDEERPPAVTTSGFKCPEDMICRPRPKPGDRRSIIGTLHHLHSGESFGPLGVVVSTVSGIALIFFSFSGLWLYISMWRNRRDRNLKPGWFWK